MSIFICLIMALIITVTAPFKLYCWLAQRDYITKALAGLMCILLVATVVFIAFTFYSTETTVTGCLISSIFVIIECAVVYFALSLITAVASLVAMLLAVVCCLPARLFDWAVSVVNFQRAKLSTGAGSCPY